MVRNMGAEGWHILLLLRSGPAVQQIRLLNMFVGGSAVEGLRP